MNIVDVAIVAFLSLFAVRGYLRGLFREVFSLVGLLVGFVVAARYYEPVARFWQDSWQFSPIFLHILCFVALFFISYLSLNLAGLLLHRTAPFLFLGGFNRLGGVLVAAGKASVVLGLTFFFLISRHWIPTSVAPSVSEAALVAPLFELGKEVVDFGRSAVELDSGPAQRGSNTRGFHYRHGQSFQQRL